ncbi:permease-like cell division protein FtsX [Amycolatopsis samaneae]|uniref:Permease-like cell division protein FtsX n=1 Tax=Amycolatopsis samaneae TaxID=664691 RepID=A0ABW5GEA1_9PSEU
MSGRPVRTGPKLIKILIPAFVLAAAIGVGVALLVAHLAEPDPLPVDTGPVPAAGRNVCGSSVVVYFETDEQMTRASGSFHGDPKTRRVFTETKAEAYERFKRIFAEHPETLRLTRPDTLPASLDLLPQRGVNLEEWAAELRGRYPEAKKVDVLDLAHLPPGLPTPATMPSCPPSGEY